MADDRTLGRVLHDARIEHNPSLERPRNVDPWEERADWQKKFDEEMAADLAAVVTERIIAELKPFTGQLVPGERRTAFHRAIEIVMEMRKAWQGQERSDEKDGKP